MGHKRNVWGPIKDYAGVLLGSSHAVLPNSEQAANTTNYIVGCFGAMGWGQQALYVRHKLRKGWTWDAS